ncbi:MAG: hypothetical protein EBR47_11260 [Betaproteobacteria bacterium]|nr:hypothetical protein [Betaproteobacteria bacterium]
MQPKPNKPIAVLFKTQTAKRIAAQSAAAALATVASYASQTYKPDAALKPAAGAANVDLSETETCKRHVARVQIERIPQTLAALQANADLFRIRTNKRIAAQQAEEEVANAALYESQIYRPCAVRRLAAAQVNVDLLGIGICRRLVGR